MLPAPLNTNASWKLSLDVGVGDGSGVGDVEPVAERVVDAVKVGDTVTDCVSLGVTVAVWEKLGVTVGVAEYDGVNDGDDVRVGVAESGAATAEASTTVESHVTSPCPRYGSVTISNNAAAWHIDGTLWGM